MGIAAAPNRMPTNSQPTLRTAPAQVLLESLVRLQVLSLQVWDALPDEVRQLLIEETNPESLLRDLVERQLLTSYQAERIAAGKVEELILGHYRILDCLGAGGTSVVYRAQHLHLGHTAAIKLLRPDPTGGAELRRRFFAEMQVIAALHHPNIVAALDAGEVADPSGEPLPYLVMEYVTGHDLDELVRIRGPLPLGEACALICQVAEALAEAHRHQLVHRDIKPSNVLVTPGGQAKLLDFGLTRDRRRRLTESGTILGTIDYMAPEQARDAHAVDIRADIYGLGATLYWCLTGRVPFPSRGSVFEDLARRQGQAPPSVRPGRPEYPAELDAVVARMMATDPDDRYPEPEAVVRALRPYLPETPTVPVPSPSIAPSVRAHRVLIVDDEPSVRRICRLLLEPEGITCDEAADGPTALEVLRAGAHDLVLLDIDMPQMRGTEVLRRLREDPPCSHLKVMMISGRATAEEMAQMLQGGADDYLTKPFSGVELAARVKAALHLKDAQDRSDLLSRHLLTLNHGLEQNLYARDSDLIHARNALTLALAELVAYRDPETGGHLLRLQRYCRRLAEEAALMPAFAGVLDENYIRMLEGCAPLHDIGKVGLPDYILLKPGRYSTDERVIMQTHTTIGAAVLEKVARRHGFAVAYLQMAADVARHHHERHDGTGYPDRLAGNAIPLAARIVALADVYDALRSRRIYKPALSHRAALEVMTEEAERQFDPSLWRALQTCAGDLEQIFHDSPEGIEL